jgi:restriction endonuclease S subunit
MNEVAFEVLLTDAQSSTAIVGLRKLILTAALRGEFDIPSEREFQLRKALQTINSPVFVKEAVGGRKPKRIAEVGTADSIAVGSAADRFVVDLGDIATIEKGKTGIKDARPGEYPMVVTAESRLSTDHFDFEGPAVIIPLVSSTGHGDASLKRIHYQDGRYAVGSILCAVQSRYPDLVHPRYLYEYLAAFKDELLVSRMSGTANVSLNVGRIADVPVPLITFDAQRKLERLMSLCDALEAKGQLEATQHVQLVSTLLATLTDSETPAQLTENWQRIATHFDLLLDRPEAVDALEQTILQLAVRGLLVPQDPQDEPASELLKKIRAEKDKLIAQGKIKHDKPLPPIAEKEQPFELPSGWEWVRLDDIADNRLGKMLDKAKNTGKRYPYLRNTNVQWRQIDLDDIKEISLEASELEEFRLLPGDLLVCEGGYPGRCAIWNEPDREMYFQKALHRVRPRGGIAVELIAITLETDSKSGNLEHHFTGATIKHFVGQALGRYLIPLPPLAEQSRIVTRVAQLRRLCADLRQRLAASQSTQAHLAEALVQEVA